MTENTGQFTLRLRPLPKPEYFLMVKLIKQYHLTDKTELIAAMLRLTDEVIRYQDGTGEQWWIQVINSLRATDHHHRDHQVPNTPPSTPEVSQ